MLAKRIVLPGPGRLRNACAPGLIHPEGLGQARTQVTPSKIQA